MQLADVKQVYFIGIGGIGMSAVARYFNGLGLPVSGYDKTKTPLTVALEAEGMTIHYGEARTDLMPAPAADLLVVWTPAIPGVFPELVKAQTEGYTLLKRAAVLGLLSESLDCVAVAGTHGKTTTTTITTYLMTQAGLHPHAFLGGIPVDFPGNYVAGQSNLVVVEADEYDRSFLHLSPQYAIVLSTDPDHLDIYGDHENMLETGFRAFARGVKPGGHLVVRYDVAEHFRGLSPDPVRFAAASRRSGERGDEAARYARGTKALDYWEVERGHEATILQFAKRLRKEATNAEKKLWRLLRNRGTGYKFVRLKPMGYSIPDFVCLEKRLIIEVDGGYHEQPEMILQDAQRDKKFADVGYLTLRFTNEQVENEALGIVRKIKSILADRDTRPYKFPTEEYLGASIAVGAARAQRAKPSPLSPGEGPGVRPRAQRAATDKSPIANLYTFGIGTGDYCARNIHVKDGAFHFDLETPTGHTLQNLRTALPGRHNIENAVAACAVTLLAGGSEEGIRRGLATFGGIKRRFETKLKTEDLVIIDDYAHHPTELTAAIGAAKELYPGRKVTGVFQPHLFSRTQDFAPGFAEALDLLDDAILIPIYPAREEPIPGVTSRMIFDQMKNPNRRLLSDEQMLEVTMELNEGVLLLLGAGDIDALIPKIVTHHQNTLHHG